MRNYTENSSNSSMHIVIFTGGNYPTPEISLNYWKQVSKPAFIIAADSGLCTCRLYKKYFMEKTDLPDFSPDMILGDMDSLPEKSLLSEYSEQIIQRSNPYKDFTDTEIAIDFAVKKAAALHKTPFITLIGGDGGRIDHLIGIYDMFSTPAHPSVWLCSVQAVWFAAAGTEFNIKDVTPEDKISISRLTAARKGGKITSTGLEWENPLFRTEGMPSISNRISEKNYKLQDPVRIVFSEGNFIMMLPYTASVTFRKTEN
ncbi:MAG: thiamine pyrophosphokinase [Treponema sp.]|nr:thiamine pyrophosphokinase [Treponema sp.]